MSTDRPNARGIISLISPSMTSAIIQPAVPSFRRVERQNGERIFEYFLPSGAAVFVRAVNFTLFTLREIHGRTDSFVKLGA